MVNSKFLSDKSNIKQIIGVRIAIEYLAGMAKTEGVVIISIEICNLEENFQFFILKEGEIDCECLLELNSIRKFKLC